MIATLKKIQAKKAAQETNGGFTLIELLIVIVVLGILAAVVVFSLGGVTATSAQAACKTDGSSINTALAAFAAQNPSGTVATQSALTAAGTTSYLQSWPNTAHYTFSLTTAGAMQMVYGSTTVSGYSSILSACSSVS